jgi:hypothetical protein
MNVSSTPNAFIKSISMASPHGLLPLGPKKLLILSFNGGLCYFLYSTILQGYVKVFGSKLLTRPNES